MPATFPIDAAAAIAAACAEPIGVEILAEGWQVGTPVLGLLDVLKSRLPESARPFRASQPDDARRHRHRDHAAWSATRCGTSATSATDAASSLRAIIETSGSVATQARSFLQPADVTTVGFRTARWLDQLDRARRQASETPTPVQLGGLIGDGMGHHRRRCRRGRRRPGLDRSPPWHTDRAPIIDVVGVATGLARWAGKVGGDIAQLVQLGEITTRAGGSSAAAGKRNPIDAMRASAAAEACLGIATVITPRQTARARTRPRQLARRVVRHPAGVPDCGRGDGGDRRGPVIARGRAIRLGRSRRPSSCRRRLRRLGPGAITLTSVGQPVSEASNCLRRRGRCPGSAADPRATPSTHRGTSRTSPR